MGDDPPAPAEPASPPDYAAANREGIEADIESLPARRKIEALAKAGGAGTVNIGGEDRYVDFTGLGDGDLTRANIPLEGEAARARAQYTLDIQRDLGDDFVTNQRELTRLSDPTRFNVNEEYAQNLIEDFRLGGKLSESEAREVEQGVRRGQAARGNMFGNAPAFQEVMERGGASSARKAQRTANVQSYLGLAPVSAQFGSINQAQGPAPINSSMYQYATNINPNAGQQAAQYAMQRYGTQAQIFGTQSNIWRQQADSNMSGMDWLQFGVGAAAGAAPAFV